MADAIGADIFEIQPEVPYTKANLNWMDKKSRSTIEMSDPASVPSRFMRKIICRLRLSEISRGPVKIYAQNCLQAPAE